MNERLGIFEELQAMRAALGPFAYVAPRIVDDEPEDDGAVEDIEGEALALLEEIARRLIAMESDKRISRIDRPSARLASQPEVADVLDAVAKIYGISVRAILSEARPKKVCRPRFAAALLLTNRLRMSSPRVARCLKRLDHTSVLHMLKRAKKLRATDPEWAALYRAAEHALDQAK